MGGNGHGGSVPECDTAVIVCSRNRAERLRATLLSLKAQTVPADQFRIIVVDDSSSDDTCSVVSELISVTPNLSLVSLPRQVGLAQARNEGVARTAARYLLFTDDDCLAAPDWVAIMRAALAEHELIAGAVASFDGNYFTLCHDVAQFYAFMPGRRAAPASFIAGANMGIRRDVIEAVGGFRQAARHAEDMDFVLRARKAGYNPWFEPKAVVRHDHRRAGFSEVLQYSAKHAQSTILLRQDHADILGTPFLLRSPSLLLAASPLIALKVSADIFLNGYAMKKHWMTAPMVFLAKMAWCLGAAKSLRKVEEISTR